MKKARPAPLDVLNRVRINNTLETPRSTIKTILNVPLQTELKFNRKNLKKVEDQLKLAFIEFHQKLRILKNYCLEESHGKYHSVGEIQEPPASVVAVATIHRPPNPHLHVRCQRPNRPRHDDSLRWPRDRVLTVLQFPHPHLQRNQHRPGFRHRQKSQLPVFRRRHHLGPLDSTPNRFDNNYYQNLVARRGLLHSDQVLFNGGSQDATVRTYSINPAAFLRDFGAAMLKMGNIRASPMQAWLVKKRDAT